MTHCTYPICNCPFDAPTDPNWCARGLPKAESHFLKNVEIRLGNNSLGWIGQTDDGNVIITAAELARLRRCRELLKEARDDVAETLNCMTASYRDSPRNKTRIDKQREFLNQIDAAIAGEKNHG